MEVTFEAEAQAKGRKSRGKGNIIYHRHNGRDLKFRSGIFKTSKKQEIEELLHSDIYKDETIQLVDPIELVDKYLKGDQPDILSEELLQGVDDEGVRKIAKALHVPQRKHKNYPEVIRTLVRGEPITNYIQKVIDEHEREKPEESLLNKAMDEGIVYRNGPWYKYRKGDEKGSKDFSIGKTEAKVQEWLAEGDTKQKLKERLN